MTLYPDTSALVKLYVEEEGSDEVKKACEQAQVVVTCRLAYAEARVRLCPCVAGRAHRHTGLPPGIEGP